MNGHRSIIAARKAKLKPSSIFFDVDIAENQTFETVPERHFFRDGNQRTKRFYFDEPENALYLRLHARVELSMKEPWRTYDFRFVIGCLVHVNALAWSDDLTDFAEVLVANGAEFLVCCCIPENADLLIFESGEWHAHG
jgi:hypothetical protein